MRRYLTRLSLGLLLAIAWAVVQSLLFPILAQETLPFEDYSLPALRAHPLPPSLAALQLDSQDDYFDTIAPLEVGYLVWSHAPITVYIEPPSQTSGDRSAVWVEAVQRAVGEWQLYLPLEIVPSLDGADITVWRKSPPLRLQQGDFRARSAETRYQLYLQHNGDVPTLAQRMTIWLRPAQSMPYLQAAARHELGHALGIWGHSSLETDALYAAQVRQPAPISTRDINTLRQIYQQPTRLGWPLPN
jgi:predicted Zn-dependent protease